MQYVVINMHNVMNSRINEKRAAMNRREGFAKQRLIVLPRTLVAELEKSPLVCDLYPTASGCFPDATGHLVERPEGSDDVILILVVSGAGWVQCATRHEVSEGSYFVIPAGVPHAYGANDSSPWTIEWIHFKGKAASSFSKLFPNNSRPQSANHTAPGKLDFAKIYDCLATGYDTGNLLAASTHLRVLLTELYRQQQEGGFSCADEAVRRCVEWMHNHLELRITLAELALAAGFSVPHFCVLFKTVTGRAPLDYFLRLKIMCACQLLDDTRSRVREIAASVGWENPFYFSRYFRKITGISPRAWRKLPKG